MSKKTTARQYQDQVKQFAARYFDVPAKAISTRTKIADLARDPLEPIAFNLDFEEKFKLAFTEEQANKMNRIRDYVAILKK